MVKKLHRVMCENMAREGRGGKERGGEGRGGEGRGGEGGKGRGRVEEVAHRVFYTLIKTHGLRTTICKCVRVYVSQACVYAFLCHLSYEACRDTLSDVGHGEVLRP